MKTKPKRRMQRPSRPSKQARESSLNNVAKVVNKIVDETDKLSANERLLFVLERLADGVDRIAQRLDSWDGATNSGDHWLDAGATINPDGEDE